MRSHLGNIVNVKEHLLLLILICAMAHKPELGTFMGSSRRRNESCLPGGQHRFDVYGKDVQWRIMYKRKKAA